MEDVLVVPVNISYDRLVETTFVKNELMVSLFMRGGVTVVIVVMLVLREERKDQRL